MVYIKKYNLETRKSEKLKNTLCYHVYAHTNLKCLYYTSMFPLTFSLTHLVQVNLPEMPHL